MTGELTEGMDGWMEGLLVSSVCHKHDAAPFCYTNGNLRCDTGTHSRASWSTLHCQVVTKQFFGEYPM
eukprot:1143328-Pelagomonas_calceolata.AAC.8